MEGYLKRKVSSGSNENVSNNFPPPTSQCEDLMEQNQSIVAKQSKLGTKEYRIWLDALVRVCRFLLNGALPFNGYNGSKKFELFFETLNFIGNQCDDETVLDECGDNFRNDQLAIVLRYVDTCGLVKERFVGIVHMIETSASALKSAIDSLFGKQGLNLKQVRGLSYNGTSTMRDEFNGLKALILQDNKSAYYVHCFAHQLQSVVVEVAQNHWGVGFFFEMIVKLTNVVNASCNKKDMIREICKDRVQEAIGHGETGTEGGLEQEFSHMQVGDTRCGSYYKIILGLITLFRDVVKVLEYVEEEGANTSSQCQADNILSRFETFDNVFYLHLMLEVLGLTNLLSEALQRKDPDMLEVVSLVEETKRQLQKFRVNGFDLLLEKIRSFCEEHDIEILDMTKGYANPMKRRNMTNISNRHHYEVDTFNTVVDMQIEEFDDRFNEVSIELLSNMVALSPRDSFSQFKASNLLKLSEMYPYDFDCMEKMNLEHELVYFNLLHQDERFANVNGIADLARLMVETRKHVTYPLIYRLLKLALVLPIANTTVELCFSTVKFVKLDLCRDIDDDFLNASVICAMEREALASVTNENVIDRLQKMMNCGDQL